jgi:hypothetical protein
MNKFTILEFVRAIFNEEETAQQAAEIGQAILAARTLRMTDIASHMEGNSVAAFKRVSGKDDLRLGWYIPIQAVENLA